MDRTGHIFIIPGREQWQHSLNTPSGFRV